MQQSLLNQRIALGLAKAAAITGSPLAVYRPTAASTPLGGTPLAMLTGAFDVTPRFALRSPAIPGHPLAFLIGDPTQVQLGDYLVGDDTHFVARVEPLRPALCVLCNQNIDIVNPDVTTSAGTNAYGGRSAITDTVVAARWPVSMLARGRLSSADGNLPTDVRAGSFTILCPPIPTVTVEYGMRIQDANGQQYSITTAELSQFGWNLLVEVAST